MIYRENSEDNYNYIYVSIVKYIFIYVIIETSRKGTVVRSGLFSSPWNEIRQSCRASCFIQEYYPVNVLKAGLHFSLFLYFRVGIYTFSHPTL